MGFLNKHPFPVEAFFRKSLVLGFAAPKNELLPLIPDCLELDLYQEKWAFLAVAIVETEGLRPKGFPKIIGRDFTLIGYRIFVRYHSESGRRLRGLYILGSETDKPAMKRLGGIFTQYQYEIISIDWDSSEGSESISSSTGLHIVSEKAGEDAVLPEQSPFPDWQKARQFVGPMPFTFSCNREQNEVIIVEGVRSSWIPKPMVVSESKVPFFDNSGLQGLKLANAFIVENVPYEWKRGVTELWTGG